MKITSRAAVSLFHFISIFHYLLMASSLMCTHLFISLGERYYASAYSKCTGDAAVAIGYYPVFDSNTQSICVNDTMVPDYMRVNPQWVHSSVKSCCERHYSWAYSDCIAGSDSDGTISSLGTNKWYVDYLSEVCKQDCSEGSDTCGGLAKTWDTLYDTAADCCGGKLWWIPTTTCARVDFTA